MRHIESKFEWAWQHHTKTKYLKTLKIRKDRKETELNFKLRVLSELLRQEPFSSFPLRVRWLELDYYEEFPVGKKPPDHITTSFGPVKVNSRKRRRTTTLESDEQGTSSGSQRTTLSEDEVICLSDDEVICLSD